MFSIASFSDGRKSVKLIWELFHVHLVHVFNASDEYQQTLWLGTWMCGMAVCKGCHLSVMFVLFCFLFFSFKHVQHCRIN